MTRACCAAAVLMIVAPLGAVPADHRLADAAERRDRAAIHTLLTEHAT